MAGFQRPTPRGLLGEVPTADGIMPGAGWSLPASIGVGAGSATDSRRMSGFGIRREQAPAESVDVTFALGSHTYRLRRPRALWNSIYHEEPIRTEEARALIAEAVQQHGNDAALVRLLQIAAPRLGRVDEETGLVLMRLRLRESRQEAVAPRAYTPPAPRPAPVAPAPPSVDEPVMSPEIAAAQAAALKEAAELGVPFCEECARAAAREAAAASPG